jgi:hypothetical protein
MRERYSGLVSRGQKRTAYPINPMLLARTKRPFR